MKSNHQLPRDKDRGFALVVTLSMMILLTVIAVGLLSLSSISLRKSGNENATTVARANAKMALMLALGELQRNAGPDQRVTADASIYQPAASNPNIPDDTPDKNTVGVWESWSPKLATEGNGVLTSASGTYAAKKTSNFKGWLSSSPSPDELKATTWATNPSHADPVELFTMKSDGHAQSASKVNVNLVKQGENSTPGKEFSGSIAWTVVQEGTKAKINVGGPENNNLQDQNDRLQAQPRPYLIGSNNFKQPSSEWNIRAGKILTTAQAKLDTALWEGEVTNTVESGDYTASSMGLLTDTVYGGLKTDINLGFDMPNGNFTQTTWGTSPSYRNPFMGAGLRGVQTFTQAMFRGTQRPLFKNPTNVSSGTTVTKLNFRSADGFFHFPASIIPTFTTLRSYYRTPNFLYNTSDGPTVFERAMDSTTLSTAANGVDAAFPYPGAPPRGQYSQTSFRPVLDRVLFVLSLGSFGSEVRLVFTPVITLWNPYNVALEIEGAVACPWMDMPYSAKWTFTPAKEGDPKDPLAMSKMMGNVDPRVEGRQIRPYFYAAITPNGGPISPGQTIRFKPGEVRVFAPASQIDVQYNTAATIPGNGALPVGQTVYMKPVTNANDMKNLKGGLAVPMKNAKSGDGFTRSFSPGDTVNVNFYSNRAQDYPFSVTLEDATRAKTNPPFPRGQAITDVQMTAFAQSATIANLNSPTVPFAQLSVTRQPFGVIETYHRVAKESRTARRSDIVYTVNPRQPFVNRALSDGSFLTAPHYETVVRTVSSFEEVIRTDETGRNAFYGRSNALPDGQSQLAFFEAPQQPIISLAAFQHADLGGTAFSTSYQIGNSWASPYLDKSRAMNAIQSGGANTGTEANYTRQMMGVYDYSYLANEALWDSFFCSSITDTFQLGSTAGTEAAWQGNGIATKKVKAETVLANFLDDPEKNPLRNPRMKFFPGKSEIADLKTDLMRPEGCLKIAAHLQVDGAFNINSTSRKAWIAVLSGLREAAFTLKNDNGSTSSASGLKKTGFPRMRYPMGTDSNLWQGYRSLTDSDIDLLADKIIAQVRLRGPFLSLGEFVNRRVDSSNLSYKGALQAAIDSTTINKAVTDSCDPFDPNIYPFRPNVSNPNNTPNIGVGIPGYLTQADLLQSLAPVITPRSDTFTIRAYGEAKDGTGKVIATARCEAVVQRVAEFVDEINPPETQIADLNTTNQNFGRKFKIVSFRYLSDNEVVPGPTT
ncbi:hypothetical protein JIN84_19265 [Luteolibacter yonseiensis]|uniref:Verru_Chthon cassette protein A n=1 Tax=Luteolibacter yonseiensis TaxID=1144680 RepID=A0A934R8B0_9BACT|nr:hypothetical protein [Luteolibacter yonseiensis]MBK1817768.1 hypothetical protein [Luteolibacter yonseiensis]